MKKTFESFDIDCYWEFCDFINKLAKQKRKFVVTPNWTRNNLYGFTVWYYE